VTWPGGSSTPYAGHLRIAAVGPNPFNPSTSVWFDALRSAKVRLEVFDVGGKRVRAIELGDVGMGRHRAQWDGQGSSGAEVASGIYFLRLQTESGHSRPVKAIRVR